MWREEEMHRDVSELLYEALGRDEKELEEIELLELDSGYAPNRGRSGASPASESTASSRQRRGAIAGAPASARQR